MMFIGTVTGSIRSVKLPFNSDSDNFQEHFAHAGPVTKLRISYDDQYLFSSSEDGCVYVYKIWEREDRSLKREKALLFADEVSSKFS
jgi:WD40 repeat protein